ncbi:multidrug effflux MFS transporter [Maritalea porphyrae]|uniref:multidrug effflux MFS transporter n=1 Tax=uncultured Maritalea sp. TaxID=757249 RepID=UPI0022B048D7|nr:multidrug effflux MFS transporter [Maritalea porphyrae]MCZ4272628.1 multidrug effflux MFS transporter [Maritalea porphyrae]
MINSRMLKNALILGLITAIGPFAIDMYLPALPAIGQDLGADTAAVQASLMSFFIALGVGQLIYGPISDVFGRKKPLYFGMILFAVCGVGCALATDINWLIGLRFFQGVGACAGGVIARAVVRDLHTGAEAAQLMSLLMLVFSISPILAPLVGSGIVAFGDWRTIFWVVTIAGVLGFLMVLFFMEESHPEAARTSGNVKAIMASYWDVLKDKHFLAMTFVGAFGMSSFMVFLANSSFVFIDHYGLNPTQYSFAFSINAVSFFAVSQLNGILSKRYGLLPLIRFGVFGFASTMILMFVVMAIGFNAWPVMSTFLFVGYGFLGLVVPVTAVLALENHGRNAGTASAMMGTLQMTTAAIAMAVSGALFDGTALPMVGSIAACALIGLTITMVSLRQQRETAAAE